MLVNFKGKPINVVPDHSGKRLRYKDEDGNFYDWSDFTPIGSQAQTMHASFVPIKVNMQIEGEVETKDEDIGNS